MALLSLSATGRLYCAEERESNWMTQLIEYSSKTGLPMVSSDIYNALTPEKKAEVDAEIERLKYMGKAGAVVGGALTAGAVASAAYGMLPSRDQAYSYFSRWMPNSLRNVVKPSAAPIVDRLITDVLYSTDFMQKPQWSKSFRWTLQQIAKGNKEAKDGFIKLIETLKYSGNKDPQQIEDDFRAMGATPSWMPSTTSDYNTVELYKTESLSVPGKLTGHQIINQLITDLETINPNVFNFLYQ